MDPEKTGSIVFKSGYSDVNGIKMYYEMYGSGEPLVLLHGGGSTIVKVFKADEGLQQNVEKLEDYLKRRR